MKRISFVLGVLLACSAAMAQPKGGPSGDEAAIRALEAKWDASNLKGDAAGLASIFADGFVSTNPEGKMRTKAEVVGDLKSGNIKYQAAQSDDVKVYLYGDTAVVTGRWRGKFTEKGKAQDVTERFTDTFARIKGEWKCVASHASTIK